MTEEFRRGYAAGRSDTMREFGLVESHGPERAVGRVVCTACNRPLQNVYRDPDGSPYGRVCFEKWRAV